jgi:hypothetical protein
VMLSLTAEFTPLICMNPGSLGLVCGEFGFRLRTSISRFNFDLLKYDNHVPTCDFLSNMLSHSLFPAIRHPTRITDQSATLIDNIFMNCIQDDFDSAIIYSDISDHLPIAVHIKNKVIKNNRSKNVKKRVYDQKSIQNFKIHLSLISWEDLYNILRVQDDPCQAYLSSIRVLHKILSIDL